MNKTEEERLLELAAQLDIETGAGFESLISEAKRFIDGCKIVPGNDKFTASMIYQLYISWCEQTKRKKPQARNHFFRDFNKYFTYTSYTASKIRAYNFDKECFGIKTEEELQDLFWKSIREDRKKYEQQKKTREEKQKKN